MPRLSPTEIRADERRKVLREIENRMLVRCGPAYVGEPIYERYIKEGDWQALLTEAGIEAAE